MTLIVEEDRFGLMLMPRTGGYLRVVENTAITEDQLPMLGLCWGVFKRRQNLGRQVREGKQNLEYLCSTVSLAN